ncbi:hypothetical protein MT899_004860 [Salmonella enterica subsp. enterica]|nr:hypothetical protein [Salmonella enterica subsp. enterica]EJB3451159.1 hypothetical protein [Salmonella enterica subsp. enterica]EJB3516132.1 hypothetical protein [Salmonella enterica subsp. enterica]EKM5283457.1 hypothetical protein [Salmonella enterica]
MKLTTEDQALLAHLEQLKDSPRTADKEIALVFEEPRIACVVTTYRDLYHVFKDILERYSDGCIPERCVTPDNEKSAYQKMVDKIMDRTDVRAGCGINNVQHAFIFFNPENLLDTYRNILKNDEKIIELGRIGRGHYPPDILEKLEKLNG